MHHAPIEPASSIEVRDERSYLKWLAQQRGIFIPANAHYGPEGIKVGGKIVLPMPGYGQSNVVEVEELDEAGNVIRSSRIGLKRNGALPWDQKKVRGIAGKAAKPAGAKPERAAAAAAAPDQGNGTPSTGGMETSGLAEQLAALCDQVQRLQAQLDAMSGAAADPVAPPAGEWLRLSGK